MEPISVMAKLIPIMLLLCLVPVQTQESFLSDYPSLISESEFLHDSDYESIVPLQIQQTPPVAEETSLPSVDLSQDFQDTNMVPLETQSRSHDDQNSKSLDSEFPEGSQDTNVPLEYRTLPIQPPFPRFPPPPPSAPETPFPKIAPSSSPLPSTPETCKANCGKKCMTKRVPLLRNLCSKNCRRRCMLHHSQFIYSCTIKCADSMPKNFKSDQKKAARYVDHCYQKCIRDF